MGPNLYRDVKVKRAMNAAAAGQTTLEGTVIDMDGFESVGFELLLGAVTNGTASSLKVQQGDLANGSDMDDLLGTEQDIADAADNGIYLSEIVKPTKRYVRLVVVRATQDVVVDGAAAHLHGARILPVTHDASVMGYEVFSSPAEGTA